MRDKILRLVLGDRLIHIQHVSTENISNYLSRFGSNDTDKVPSKGGLCSSFCVAEKSEQEAYDEVNSSSGKIQALKDPNHIETCKERHKKCLCFNLWQSDSSIKDSQAERLTFDKNLSILAVCRQLYEESNNILWQTNVFSFDSAESFTVFNQSMNSAQKHKLKKIHLWMDVPIDALNPDGFCLDWASATAQRVLTPLENLKFIHVSINQYSLWGFYPWEYDGPIISNASSRLRVGASMDQMLGLRLLPWQNKENKNPK